MAHLGRWMVGLGLVLLTACGPADDIGSSSVGGTSTEEAQVTNPSPSTASTAPAPSGPVTVIQVVDGDTLEVRLENGRVDRLRLIGINAPEDGECLSTEATNRLRELLSTGRVRLLRDVSDRDQYGRLLRYVLVDGESVGESLVAEGLALSRAYPPDTSQQVALDAAQAAAMSQGRGLWAPDACGPATEAAVVVGEVRSDPPGDESQHPNDEWVEILNHGTVVVDLTGWGVKDESASHRFEFPDGFRLGPGETVRIHTGCGAASATHLYWCVSGSAVWNNDGDTAFLTDPQGNVVDQRPT